jgi:hypothetical protein
MDAPASAPARAFSVVVLGITPTRLPARSFTVPMPESAVASRLPPSTEIMWLNATCSMRPNVIVVDPHSRSIAPLTSFGMRSAGVTGTQATLRPGSFSDSRSAAATCRQRSTENPAG